MFTRRCNISNTEEAGRGRTLPGNVQRSNMNILVCVKQVPDVDEIQWDPVTKTIIRESAPAVVNPFDKYAMESAALIKDADEEGETRIILLSMGPEQAKDALYECLAVGGDVAYLVSGRVFAGADTLATSYTLSCAIKKIEEREGKIDLILCGQQSSDRDTAQVGPELAEHLDIPHITNANSVAIADGCVTVTRRRDNARQVVSAPCPCLVTVARTADEPRYAGSRMRREARMKEINVLSQGDFEFDATRVGLAGSPTKTAESIIVEHKKDTLRFDGANAADRLFDALKAAELI